MQWKNSERGENSQKRWETRGQLNKHNKHGGWRRTIPWGHWQAWLPRPHLFPASIPDNCSGRRGRRGPWKPRRHQFRVRRTLAGWRAAHQQGWRALEAGRAPSADSLSGPWRGLLGIHPAWLQWGCKTKTIGPRKWKTAEKWPAFRGCKKNWKFMVSKTCNVKMKKKSHSNQIIINNINY